MAKKKKTSSPFKVKEEKKDTKDSNKEGREAKEKDNKAEVDAPIKSPVSPPPGKEDDELELTGTEVVSARDKLKSILAVLFTKNDEPDPDSPEPAPKVTAKKERTTPSHNSSSSRLSASSIATRHSSRQKKRRRNAPTDQAFHHTYVMKLFDRSVDLAQFKEDTPLYPICRAWMANQPRNTNLGKRSRSPSPVPTEDDDLDGEESAEGEKDKDKSETEEEPVVKKIYKMPAPEPLPTDPEGKLRLRVPVVISRGEKKEVNLDMEVKPSKDTLLKEHILHWTAVRKSWHAVGHKNEQRFAGSTQVLKSIFKKPQLVFD